MGLLTDFCLMGSYCATVKKGLRYQYKLLFFYLLLKVPYTDISHSAKSNLWPVISRWRQKTDSFELVNAYGLFRR